MATPSVTLTSVHCGPDGMRGCNYDGTVDGVKFHITGGASTKDQGVLFPFMVRVGSNASLEARNKVNFLKQLEPVVSSFWKGLPQHLQELKKTLPANWTPKTIIFPKNNDPAFHPDERDPGYTETFKFKSSGGERVVSIGNNGLVNGVAGAVNGTEFSIMRCFTKRDTNDEGVWTSTLQCEQGKAFDVLKELD